MAPPTLRVNTFVQADEKHFIDPLSKAFIVCELALGLNRLPLFGEVNIIFIVLAVMYALLLKAAITYTTYVGGNIVSVIAVINIMEYGFCIAFSFISWKRMLRYYSELNKFDIQVGCRPKIAQGSITNIIQMCITIMFVVVLLFLPYEIDIFKGVFVQLVPVNIIHILEVHYYGHLLNLLTPRLRLINYYMETSLSNIEVTNTIKIKDFIFFKSNVNDNCEMKKLMDLYHIIIQAYNYLIEAIKWQLLVIIITSFITVLCYCYHYSLSIIRGGNPLSLAVSDLGLTVVMMLPLFAPCLFGDRVHNEVRRLRELLASRLYENKLDKSSRNMARALLALAETRDLSFSLLRMLAIDISLPFKFVGLLVTYLIILLQFEKVINP